MTILQDHKVGSYSGFDNLKPDATNMEVDSLYTLDNHDRCAVQQIEEGGIQVALDTHTPNDTPNLTTITMLVEQAVRSRETSRKARIRVNNQVEALKKYGVTNIFFLDHLANQVKRFHEIEKQDTKTIERIMKQHPIAQWVIKECPGVGLDSAASILNITGPLNLYSCPSKVWKMLGLHVYPSGEGGQGEAPDIKKYKRQKDYMLNRQQLLDKPDYTGVDYSPKGHGICFVLGGCLEKQKGGVYKDIINTRKAHTLNTHPEWTPIHRRYDANRIAVKAFVKDMWCEWRDLGLQAERIRIKVEVEGEDQSSSE